MKLHLYLLSILLLVPHQIFCKEKQTKSSTTAKIFSTLPSAIPTVISAVMAWQLYKLTQEVRSAHTPFRPVISRRGSASSSDESGVALVTTSEPSKNNSIAGGNMPHLDESSRQELTDLLGQDSEPKDEASITKI